MNYFILLAICFLSVEILIRSKYLNVISSTIKLVKKAIYVIMSKNISDHWKENIIPKYSLKIMNFSLKSLFTLLTLTSIFLLLEIIFVIELAKNFGVLLWILSKILLSKCFVQINLKFFFTNWT